MVDLRRNKEIILIIIFTLTLIGCSKDQASNVKLKTGHKLGTVIKIKIYHPQAEKLAQDSFTLIDEIENRMSSHTDNSEINEINRFAGQKAVEVSSETYYVIKEALDYAQLSAGAFDPTIGPLVQLWGIGTKEEQVPKKEKITEKLALVDYGNVKLMKENKVLLSKAEMRLDVGGIAKGYAADRVIAYLKEKGVKSAYIDIGGNVSVLGTKENNDQWTVGIQDPKKERGKILAALEAENKTIVSSGNYERYFTEQGTRYHHLLNPKTGYPARKGVIGTTIVAKNSLKADALSTAVYVLGLEKGLSLVKDLEDVEAVVVTEDNKIHITSGLEDKIQISNRSDYQIIREE
ncbi:MAG: FAD:protein FMN transferase [Halanaerobacter sp.]